MMWKSHHISTLEIIMSKKHFFFFFKEWGSHCTRLGGNSRQRVTEKVVYANRKGR